MTRDEQRLAEILHEVAPTSGGVSYDDVVRKARRRRTTRLGAVGAAAAVVAGSVVAAVTLTSTGNGPAQLTTGPSPSTSATSVGCYPSPLRLSSNRVPAGASVTVVSAAFRCDGSYPAGKTYTLVLGQVGRGDVLRLGVVPVNRDGSFSADVRVPAAASPGESYIVVHGSVYDLPCQDTSSQSASCATYAAQLTVLAPGSPAAAMSLCQSALGSAVVAASSTTVNDARGWKRGGPPPMSSADAESRRPARKAWPSAASSDPAAWCTTGTGGEYTFYAAGPDGTAVQLERVGGLGPNPPDRPPAIP